MKTAANIVGITAMILGVIGAAIAPWFGPSITTGGAIAVDAVILMLTGFIAVLFGDS